MNRTGILEPSGLAIHLPALRRRAAGLCGSWEAGEDLVQDTFERVLRSPRRVDGEARAYLMRALRNTHIDRVRAAARRPQTVELMPDGTGSPAVWEHDQALIRTEAREVLRAVAALSDAYRDVVVAVDVQGCSYGEAADRCGIPIGTVMSRLYRGRRQVVRAVTAPTTRDLVGG